MLEMNNLNFLEKTLNSKTIYSGKIFTIKLNKVSLPNNHTATRELAIKQNAACVVALTKSKKIVLVKQFRNAIQKNLWEVPAGKKETNETALQCAKRELIEETGFNSTHWINIGKITPCPGFCNEQIGLFLALNAVKACAPKPDPDEFVKTGLFNFDEIAKHAALGNLTDAKTTCAILRTHFLISSNKINF